MIKQNYIYSATITNVVDGDTVDANIDLGFTVWVKIRFRLNSIDTPELNSPDAIVRESGQKAKEYVKSVLLGKTVTISSFKADKYGRWLADIYLPDGELFNDRMINEGYAVPYFGGKR